MADISTNATLTITKGAKIKAEGLALDPIVFTSNKISKRSGDWGGIIILGDAPTNRVGVNSVASVFYPKIKSTNYEKTNYGGKKAKSNSGIFKYVRIEYAGKKVKDSNVANALLLAAIGSKTEVNNVMVSYSGDNAFNIIGGEVNLEQMVSYKSKGNDYKFSYGTQSTISNSLAARYSGEPSSSGSQCLNVVSYDKRQEVDFNKKGTSVSAKNMTFLTHSNDVKSDIKSGLIQNSIYVGVHSSLKMDRSVISSFNKAVVLSDEIDLNQSNLEKIRFTNMYFNNCNGNIFLENNENNEDLEARYGNAAFFNIFAKHAHSETFVDIESKRPNYDLRI